MSSVTLKLTSSVTCYPVFRDRPRPSTRERTCIGFGRNRQARSHNFLQIAFFVYENHGGGFKERAVLATWPQIRKTTTHASGKNIATSGNCMEKPET
jgi:hypothetical protein